VTDVSIIIPTYNRARFLGATIDSALAQGEGVEVIVVDDGSTDGTAGLLANYGERVRFLRQSKRGPSAARNLGAVQARGDYLFFLDSDDLIEPGAIAGLLERARTLGPDRVPFGQAMTVDEANEAAVGPAYGFPHLAVGHDLRLADLLGGVMPLCLSLTSRKSFHSLGGLRTDLRLGEDHEFAVRMHLSGLVYVATDVRVLRVRLHGDPRLSCTGDKGFGERALQLWSMIVNAVGVAEDFDRQAERALARMIWIAGRGSARGGDEVAAQALFALACSLDPKVDQNGRWPFRLLSWATGPYRAERCAEQLRSLLCRR
jgi:glycosyltransferase involved in cell wall biosynthesis